MDATFSHNRSQALLRQRNMLLVSTLTLLVLVSWLVYAVTSKDRQVVLTPTLSRPLTISTAGVSPEYFELVTRDVALIALNRSPTGLDYWMESILKLAHPAAHGSLKAELVRLVKEQRGSDVAQSFTPTSMTIDPKRLTSDVTGELRTFVGRTVVSSERKSFRFRWAYNGLSLSLTGFRMLLPTNGRAS